MLCRGRVGKLRVDNWADSVLNCTAGGNAFIRGHNRMKTTLKSLFTYCGILAEVEPYGVFADLVPQRALNRVQGHRASQAIIPDLQDWPGSALAAGARRKEWSREEETARPGRHPGWRG